MNDEQIKYIITFIENNKTIPNINTNHYDSLNEEIIRYKNICLNRLTDDFSAFEQDKKALAAVYNHYYEGNIMEDYKNKKLGIMMIPDICSLIAIIQDSSYIVKDWSF